MTRRMRRFRQLLSIPVILLAIVVITVASAPSAYSADQPGGGDGGQEDPALELPGDAPSTGDGDGGPEPPGSEPTGGSPGNVVPGDSGSAVPSDAVEGYYVRVSLEDQTVFIYLDGVLVRSMVCSGGTSEKPTPVGRFYIQNRGEFFFSEKYQQGGWWWVSFRDWGIYLFHSVPTDRSGNILVEEAAKLGQPASHGCIRLTLDDARWFYENITQGTPVDIS